LSLIKGKSSLAKELVNDFSFDYESSVQKKTKNAQKLLKKENFRKCHENIFLKTPLSKE